MVEDHSYVVLLGAGVLIRWWQDLGDHLGAGHPASAIAEEFRSERALAIGLAAHPATIFR